MNVNVDVVTIDDTTYAIINEIPYKDTVYLFLSNLDDEDDAIIQKLDKDMDTIIPLDDDREYDLACNIFFKSLS